MSTATKRPRVVVTQQIPMDWLGELPDRAEVKIRDNRRVLSADEVADQLKDFDGAITMLSDPLPAVVLDRLPRLQVIGNFAVGVNNIDLDAAANRGVVVTNTPGVLTEATAELAFALLLSAARRIVEADAYCRSGSFVGWHATLLLGTGLNGKTLGIYGMGRIGQAMARRAAASGMTVIYHNRRPVDPKTAQTLGATSVTFDQLLERSNAISLHCPLNEDSRGRFGGAEFDRMRPGSIFINTARGPVVDEGALAQALGSGHLRSAGLDVYEHEPKIHPALLSLPNVVLAPHVGSGTTETRRQMAGMVAADVLAVLEGRPPAHRVG